MSNIIPFPTKTPDCLSVDGGWLKGYPIGGEAGQFYFVTYHYGDEFDDVIFECNSYDEAIGWALAEAKQAGLQVFDKARRSQ
jgi:hypothetical protein